MNLGDLNSDLPKPWLNIKCNSLDTETFTTNNFAATNITGTNITGTNITGANILATTTLTANDRLKQNSTFLTPYSLWSGLNDFNFTNQTTFIRIMGIFVGSSTIASNKCYPGMTTKIVLSGDIPSGGTDSITFRVADFNNTIVHAEVECGYAATPCFLQVEFTIQITAVGGVGVGFEKSSGVAWNSNPHPLPTQYVANVGPLNSVTGFSTTNGVDYHIFAKFANGAGRTFTKRLSYATVVY